MFLNKEDIKAKSACSAGVKWFEHYFPNGAELKEVIQHERVPNFFLYWGCEQGFFLMNKEEQQAYMKKLNIECDTLSTIISSCNIKDSEFVFKGRDVTSSSYISSGKKIKNSFMIQAGHNIEKSQYVFDGRDIKNSQYIYISQSITDSVIIAKSENISDSIGVLNGREIEGSFYILGEETALAETIKDSSFILRGKNLSKCLFCSDIQNKELLFFNKPISLQRYKELLLKINELKQDWTPNLIGAWCEEKMPLLPPQLQPEENYASEIPNELLEWLKTLPEYNEEILFEILKR